MDGRLPRGSQLPSEIELARAMGVSRTSIREAVMALEQDGLLTRRHGYGTFVRNTPQLQSSLNVNLSATELIKAHGQEPGTRAARVYRARATAHEASRLGLADGDPVIVLERVRTADDRPVVATRDVIPASLLARASVDPEALLQENLSLYRFFAETLAVSVVDGTTWIYPKAATAQVAEELEIAVGAPTLVLEQVDRDAAELRVLLTWEQYVPDAIEFVMHRRGPHLPRGSIRALEPDPKGFEPEP